MLKNTLGVMAAALVCGGCSQPGSIVGMAPAELPMPKQIDVVFNRNAQIALPLAPYRGVAQW